MSQVETQLEPVESSTQHVIYVWTGDRCPAEKCGDLMGEYDPNDVYQMALRVLHRKIHNEGEFIASSGDKIDVKTILQAVGNPLSLKQLSSPASTKSSCN